MKKLLLLEPVRKKGNHQFFMDWFARAWQACGGGIKRRRPLPWPALLAVACDGRGKAREKSNT